MYSKIIDLIGNIYNKNTEGKLIFTFNINMHNILTNKINSEQNDAIFSNTNIYFKYTNNYNFVIISTYIKLDKSNYKH